MQASTPIRHHVNVAVSTALVAAYVLAYVCMLGKWGPFADGAFAHRAVLGMRVANFLLAVGVLLKIRADKSARELAQRPNRPMVSEGEYVLRRSERAGLAISGAVLCGLGYIALAAGILGTLLFLGLYSGGDTSPWFPVYDIGLIAFAALAIRLGHYCSRKSLALDPGIPGA